MPLCKLCASIPLDFFLKPRFSCNHCESLEALLESAVAGCDLCKLIWWAAKDGNVQSGRKGGAQDVRVVEKTVPEDKIEGKSIKAGEINEDGESIKNDKGSESRNSEDIVAIPKHAEDRPVVANPDDGSARYIGAEDDSSDSSDDISSIGQSSSGENSTQKFEGIILCRSGGYPSESICIRGEDFNQTNVAIFEYSHKSDKKLPFGTTGPWWETEDGGTDPSKTQWRKYMREQKALKIVSKAKEQLEPPKTLADCTLAQCQGDDFFDIGVQERIYEDDLPKDEPISKTGVINNRDTKTNSAKISNEKFNIRPLPSKPEDSMFLIRAWIDNCVSNHTLCGESETESHVPTRLIRVGKLDETNVQLVTTSNSEKFGTYLALSHCWGLLPPEEKTKMTTTTSNLNERLDSISLASLPKSFVDAIHITRLLGEKYLWIDSLCIVQDSVDDWERESRVMGLIYGNALCTLAAAEAKNSSEGIFRSRDEIPASLSITLPSQYQDDQKDSEKHHIFLHPVFPSYKVTVPHTPLASRAWTLQERQLSRRIVSFTANQIFWECTCSSASETAPREGLGSGLEAMYVPSFDQSTGPANHRQLQAIIKGWGELTAEEEDEMRREMGDVNPPSPYRNWYTLVSVFTIRSITNEMDTLPALAGMSSDLAKRIGSHYISGLWEEDMLFGLAWRPSGKMTRPAKWRAPSWSWASLNGPVSFNNEFPKATPLNIRAVEANSTPRSTLNPYGAVACASLKVSGFIKAGVSGIHRGLGLPYVSWIQADESRAAPGKGGVSILSCDIVEDKDKYLGTDKVVYCMYVGTCVWNGPIGLALVPTGENPDEYRRIGCISVSKNFFWDIQDGLMGFEESGIIKPGSKWDDIDPSVFDALGKKVVALV